MLLKFSRVSVVCNTPVILTHTILSASLLILDTLLPSLHITRDYFSAWPISWSHVNPLNYHSKWNWLKNIGWTAFRLVSHVFGHNNFPHLFGNFKFILLVGPTIELEYGRRLLVQLLGVVALTSGVFHGVTSKDTILCGASGVVFSFVALSTKRGLLKQDSVIQIPATLLLVLLMFLSQEIWEGLSKKDSISQISHVLGALCGLGFALNYIETKTTASTLRNLLNSAKAPFYYYTPANLDSIKKKE